MTTDNKTLAVDVLAVMDHESDRIEERIGYGLADDLRDARAAVAELIEADVAYDKAYAGAVADPANEAALDEAEERRAAALARVKGESA